MMVDFTKQLRNDRKQYVRLREITSLVAARHPGTDLGKAKAEECRILSGAIANTDAAINVNESS
jgi:hypothetical protein